MQRPLLLAKIPSCTLTAVNLDYRDSISIAQTLLDAAGILVYEQVQVVNITKVERLITYALSAPANSGAIKLNGAAARMGMKGDRLIIMSYCQLAGEELKNYSPRVILVDEQNPVVEVRTYTDLLTLGHPES